MKNTDALDKALAEIEARSIDEASIELQDHSVRQKSEKEAAQKAMNLLLYKDRSEQELIRRLRENEFEEPVILKAIAYVKQFGYINDQRYAENYVVSMKDKKSKMVMRRFLMDKGIRDEFIDEALSAVESDESEIAGELLQKKYGTPHRMDEKELRRSFAYLARRGFASGNIWKALHRYQETEGV